MKKHKTVIEIKKDAGATADAKAIAAVKKQETTDKSLLLRQKTFMRASSENQIL